MNIAVARVGADGPAPCPPCLALETEAVDVMAVIALYLDTA